MNAAFLGADCLPRGGQLDVKIGADPAQPSFHITATSQYARVLEEVERAVRGETAESHLDARGIQPYLTYKLARQVNAGLTLTSREGVVEIAAG